MLHGGNIHVCRTKIYVSKLCFRNKLNRFTLKVSELLVIYPNDGLVKSYFICAKNTIE